MIYSLSSPDLLTFRAGEIPRDIRIRKQVPRHLPSPRTASFGSYAWQLIKCWVLMLGGDTGHLSQLSETCHPNSDAVGVNKILLAPTNRKQEAKSTLTKVSISPPRAKDHKHLIRSPSVRIPSRSPRSVA